MGFEQGGYHEAYSNLGFLGGIAIYRSGTGDTHTVSHIESPVQYLHTLMGQDEQDAVLVDVQSQRCIPWTRNNATTGPTTDFYIDGSLLYINGSLLYARHRSMFKQD